MGAIWQLERLRQPAGSRASRDNCTAQSFLGIQV
jgi:hypothetical protein